MQTLEPRISGTRDYVGEDAVALRTARDKIEDTFRRYAYAPIDPPVLERSSPFLDRSGEDIRRRLYIFSDPGGREVCLRPELTIPACRTYLRQLQSPEGERQFSQEREARLCYVGTAFRYESTSEGRYRQFYQAGAELVGAKRREAADAEILAVGIDALEHAGLKNAVIEMGDLEILHAFIDGLPISVKSKARLRRLALRNRKMERFVSAVSSKEIDEPERSANTSELAALLASAEPGKAELLMKEVLALADVRHVGGRSPEEIVERLIVRAAQRSAEPISSELLEGISALLSIRTDPDSAFNAVREHFNEFGIHSIDAVLERCAERLGLFMAYRGDSVKLQFNVGLRRGLEYYTGFVFEIFAQDLPQIGHLCGGGRYDNLLEALGANVSVPAVGFAIGLDRLLVARHQSRAAILNESRAPHALIVAAGVVPHEECIRVSMALRNAGWSVETDTSGYRARSGLSYAQKRNIPYVVIVGEDELKNGQVSIKRLHDHTEQIVVLSMLEEYVRRENIGQSSEKSET